MKNRWIVLAVLFLVRTITGIQYQSVASVSSFLIEDLGIDYVRLGILIGFYQFPGIILAVPAGVLGKRFDDKQIVTAGLGLMAAGGLIMGGGDSYVLAVIGRSLSGVGAVLLNVFLTKMVVDWFAGQEIVTAMAIFVSSWPFGISLGLISQGTLALATAWTLIMYLNSAISVVGLLLIIKYYQPPDSLTKRQLSESRSAGISSREVWLVQCGRN